MALALRDGDSRPAFAVGAATLAVLSRRAEDAPLVVLLDDAHLLDQPSAPGAGLRGAAAGRRPGARRWPPSGRRGRAASPRRACPSWRSPGSTPPRSGRSWPRSASRPPRRPRPAPRTVTAGNPLAVTELVRRPDALARLALDDPIPLSGRLVEVFAERAGELGADVQLVVALTALAGGSATLVVEAARALGLDDAALGRAEAAALVDLDGDHVAPRHPLVGSAVYSSLSAEQRRRLHAAVAEALPPGRTDERARHLAAAAAGPDEGLAAALEQVAAAAAGRGAPAVAAAGLERAAGITPDAGRRTAPAPRGGRGGLGRG